MDLLREELHRAIVADRPAGASTDLPEHYDEHADAFRFIRDVPTDWEDSRTLQGKIGEYAVVARRDRNSLDWYLGAITSDTARRLTVPLDFLDKGARYEATIYADGPGADWRTAPDKLAIRQQMVTAGDQLSLDLASGGGQAIRFRRFCLPSRRSIARLRAPNRSSAGHFHPISGKPADGMRRR
ncbi:glycoside hydrolase family 97 C-terminal domain-containing protein [Sphingomonas sp. 1185]|uniref:glycoside hydrolase family 97 C-terminal domain-containing protein n=1 Tax=Sphingomonas sp. 1185 TaxID=3156411 RepID=UPI003391FF0B